MNNVNEIKMANAKLLTEKAKLERIETVISEADHISSEFCAEGYRTYRKIKNIEADLCGMYLNQLLIVYPWFKGEATLNRMLSDDKRTELELQELAKILM